MKPLLLPFLFLLYACDPEIERQTSFEYKPPKVIEAKGHIITPDSISPPVVVQATNPTKILVGKPEIVHLASNVFTAKIMETIPAGSPAVIFSHGKTYEPPRVITVRDSPYAAGAPEMVTVAGRDVSEVSTGMFSTIQAKHGLNSNEISSLIQDRNGNLWIGAWWGGGISRYDGRSLWNYGLMQGLSSDVINCVYEDSKGNIWTGSYNNGVNRFDGNLFTHYSIKEGLQDNIVYNIIEDRSGVMWFGTYKGLTKFDGRFFTHYTTSQGLPTNRVLSLMEDKKGQLWIGTNGGLTRFDGKCFHNYTNALHFDDNTEVSTLLEDATGNIWIGTNIGLFKYDGTHFSHFTTTGGLSSDYITSIIQERNGDIWVGTRGGGANRYDGKSFFHYGPAQGLPNDIVTSIVEDKWRNIWFGTTAGVCKYEGKMFTHILPIKQEEIESLVADSKGSVWMGSGTDSCLNRYDGANMMRYSTEQGLINTQFNCLYEDKHGNLWMGTWNGVDRYDGKYLTHYSKANGLVDSVVFSVLEDSRGNFWFGTTRGLSKFDGKHFSNYKLPQGLCSETITYLLEDHDGMIWIATNDNGICKFDGKTFTHYYAGNNVSHPMVLGLAEDRNNNIWICTTYGVNKFDGKHFTWYTTDQGLTNNITKTVLEDKNGEIWVGTINGLNRYKSQEKSENTFKIDAPSYFKNYTTTDYFSGAGTYENSMSMDKRGNIWIGSNDRLTLYHPEGDIRDTIAPVLRLTGISLFAEKINWHDVQSKKNGSYKIHNGKRLGKIQFSGLSRWYNQPENLQLAYNNNVITFRFIGITTNRPKEVKYRYMLDGLDETWTSTVEPAAVYNKIPHGKYNFRVQSANSEGYWSNELNYSFVIFPPWWQNTLAYCAYALLLAAIIWMVAWYRARRLRAENILLEEKVTRRTNELEQSLEERYRLSEQIKSQQALLNERLRISRDLHDEIGSTLGSISIYSEVAKKRSEKNENTVTVLSKIGVASRELIDKMSDIVWSLNLNHENFGQMQHRMRAFATMIFTPRNIHYDFDIDENSHRAQLSNAQTKNIFLIYKEALYNIVKYADCNTVHIDFRTGNNELIMTIRDNGKGFDQHSIDPEVRADEHLGGNGIKNMHVRSAEIQANLTIVSQLNAGTTITLRTPL